MLQGNLAWFEIYRTSLPMSLCVPRACASHFESLLAIESAICPDFSWRPIVPRDYDNGVNTWNDLDLTIGFLSIRSAELAQACKAYKRECTNAFLDEVDAIMLEFA